jgi:hypothetical protein
LSFAVSHVERRDIDGQRRQAKQRYQRNRNQYDGYATFVLPMGSVGTAHLATLQIQFCMIAMESI